MKFFFSLLLYSYTSNTIWRANHLKWAPVKEVHAGRQLPELSACFWQRHQLSVCTKPWYCVLSSRPRPQPCTLAFSQKSQNWGLKTLHWALPSWVRLCLMPPWPPLSQPQDDLIQGLSHLIQNTYIARGLIWRIESWKQPEVPLNLDNIWMNPKGPRALCVPSVLLPEALHLSFIFLWIVAITERFSLSFPSPADSEALKCPFSHEGEVAG